MANFGHLIAPYTPYSNYMLGTVQSFFKVSTLHF